MWDTTTSAISIRYLRPASACLPAATVFPGNRNPAEFWPPGSEGQKRRISRRPFKRRCRCTFLLHSLIERFHLIFCPAQSLHQKGAEAAAFPVAYHLICGLMGICLFVYTVADSKRHRHPLQILPAPGWISHFLSARPDILLSVPPLMVMPGRYHTRICTQGSHGTVVHCPEASHPRMVCVFMISNSSFVRRPGLFKIASGIAILPISCMDEALTIIWISEFSRPYSG